MISRVPEEEILFCLPRVDVEQLHDAFEQRGCLMQNVPWFLSNKLYKLRWKKF